MLYFLITIKQDKSNSARSYTDLREIKNAGMDAPDTEYHEIGHMPVK